jgi:hypothetical protein
MEFLLWYERTISWIVSHCPDQPDKFAHTFAGLGIWLAAGLLLRKPLRSPWPLLAVIAFEVGNEVIDRLAHGSWRLPDTTRDLAATWFWPFVLFACLRLFPWLSGPNRAQPEALPPPLQHHVERPRPAMPPVRAANRDDIPGVLACSEPV